VDAATMSKELTRASAGERQVQERRKRRRLRGVILLCLVLIPLLTYLETKVIGLGPVDLPVSGNVLIYLLININLLLLLLMVFLVMRSVVQLVFERRQRFLGTRLRTKLVISFVSLSLIPTGLLFFISLQFVSTSMDYWFNINVEKALLGSLDFGKNVYQENRSRVTRLGTTLATRLETENYRPTANGDNRRLVEFLADQDLAGLEFISAQRQIVTSIFAPRLRAEEVPPIPAELLRRSLEGERNLVVIQEVAAGELVRGLTPLRLVTMDSRIAEVMIISLLIPHEHLERMQTISSGLEGYRQLMIMKAPIKTSLLVMLLIVTLLIVFCAIWFGFYVARGLTGPIRQLGEATRQVAEGNLDFVLEKESGDEMGLLVDSFNQMTRDLRTSKRQIEAANRALQTGNLELEKRRRYTETILQNVAAGVISLDENGKVTTINRFAEELLQINGEEILYRDCRSVLHPAHLEILEGFLEELSGSGKSSIQRPLRLSVRDETFSLRVNFTRLEDEEGIPLGVVLVFDNLTELEKAQRLAAWREVARRIAHEVKNPLTPIQLSAQRLRKKYLERLGPEGEVFDSCTRTIINQVDELKRLVSEFSSFARMPAVSKSLHSLAAVAREVLSLYQEAHKQIAFTFIDRDGIPDFFFDAKQMKRVLINLLDNAVAVLPEEGGRVDIELQRDEEQGVVFLEVRDNGPGVEEKDKLRLFEPYFSTKKTGTGLGLAIATTVVADHGGYLRLKDNEPRGARFVIELPLVTG
jgi:two-component system, NtrC family, nitrogen regulation sensor histidine kinase NtrY